MSAPSAVAPFVAHRVPGRVRLKVPEFGEQVQDAIEARIRSIRGVKSVRSEALTGSVVVQFDPGMPCEEQILGAISRPVGKRETLREKPAEPRKERAHAVLHEGVTRHGPKVVRRVRVAVAGLDRDSSLARTVVKRLTSRPGVHARANPLTGRVLIEFDDQIAELRDLLGDIAEVELPGLPGEDDPVHPMDPAPLTQSAVRTAGAAAGLSVLAARRLIGAEGPILAGSGWAYASGVISVMQGIPWIRNGVRRLLGKNIGDLSLTLPDMAIASLVSSPLGLLVNGAGAARLLSTVMARRHSWKQYEDRLGDAPSIEPGGLIRLESGEIAPMPATVIEGFGTSIDFCGQVAHFGPGDHLSSGSKVRGSGPFVLELRDTAVVETPPRSGEPAPTPFDRYNEWNPPLSLAFATVLGLATRSPARAFEAMLCLNPRAATGGSDAASLNATARVIRGGAVVVGTRPNRHIRLPNTLILESARIVTDGLEVAGVRLLEPGVDAGDALHIAAQVSHAAGSPWGEAFGKGRSRSYGEFSDGRASATIDGTSFLLEPDDPNARLDEGDHQRVVLSRVSSAGKRPIAKFSLRPRLAAGLPELIKTCQKHAVQLIMLSEGDGAAARHVAHRAGISVATGHPANLISKLQEQGQRVAYVSDGAHGAGPFAQCDLAIGLTSGHHGRFAARADVLAADLGVLNSIIEAGAIGKTVVRDSVGLGIIANIVGVVMCLSGPTGIVAASRAVNLAALCAYANAAWRFKGGERPSGYTDRYADPRPEQRWGKRSIDEVLKELRSSPFGLEPGDAQSRIDSRSFAEQPRFDQGSAFLKALFAQICSPLIGLMGLGAALTFAVGTPVEFGLVATTIVVNILFGAWQERQVQGASTALVQMAPTMATVIRGGMASVVPAPELVPGDIVSLVAGDRVPADARLIESESFEVDESSLTGEWLPVPKSANAASDSGRIVLEGSDVTVGRARAVVFAVGRKTRMGTIAAAVSQEDRAKSPLNNRLAKLLQQFLPLAAIAGVVVFGAGVLQGRNWTNELVFATTLALSAIPEGLPLLAGLAEVAVARRLANHKARLRRLGAVEALGRVDIACTDKTGTLTQGNLVLSMVATDERVALLETSDGALLSGSLRDVVIAAALASPHPDSGSVRAHPTDMAVLEGAARLSLAAQVSVAREEEAPFEPTRAFHSSRALGRVYVKGSPEAVVERCTSLRSEALDLMLDASGREKLLRDAERIASRGMRVLMVAQGPSRTKVEDPNGLTFLGFLGIRDPLRHGVQEAVQRCRDAGVRVMMLTGDHPATARAIGVDAGLMNEDDEVLTGFEISTLTNAELDERLSRVSVLARVTPLEKVRIVESLQRMGHTVAMTGDGVNDAPALRLADVGVAMGLGGTEVARQAADVVLDDDNFTTLVEALVEGRGFWRNIRRTLGLLLGGILGELGFVAIAAAIGLAPALNTRQILAMNLITFGLPTLAVALQEPEHRNLAGLAREGTTALDKPLRRDVLQRAAATIIPSLIAYILALPLGPIQAQTVAFGAAIGSQLAQTVDSGRVESGLTKSVMGAVGSAFALLLASFFVPSLRALLTLAIPSAPAWLLILAASCLAPVVARTLSALGQSPSPARLAAA
jgi:cation-transporting ATPase I